MYRAFICDILSLIKLNPHAVPATTLTLFNVVTCHHELDFQFPVAVAHTRNILNTPSHFSYKKAAEKGPTNGS